MFVAFRHVLCLLLLSGGAHAAYHASHETRNTTVRSQFFSVSFFIGLVAPVQVGSKGQCLLKLHGCFSYDRSFVTPHRISWQCVFCVLLSDVSYSYSFHFNRHTSRRQIFLRWHLPTDTSHEVCGHGDVLWTNVSLRATYVFAGFCSIYRVFLRCWNLFKGGEEDCHQCTFDSFDSIGRL